MRQISTLVLGDASHHSPVANAVWTFCEDAQSYYGTPPALNYCFCAARPLDHDTTPDECPTLGIASY